MMKLGKWASLLFITSTLLGCVYYHRTPAYTGTCRSLNLLNSYTESHKDDSPRNSFILYADGGQEFSSHLPFAKDAFWLRLTGNTRGRKQFYREAWSPSGLSGAPMYYFPGNAYIQREDGSRIEAAKAIYFPSERDPTYPGEQKTRDALDLNSDMVQTLPRSKTRAYGYVFIKFPVPPPSIGDRWTVSLGEIDLDGRKVNIPDIELCDFPATKIKGSWNMSP